VVVVATCPDFGVVKAIPQPLRWTVRTLGLRLARAQSGAVTAAGGVPVPLASLVNDEFRHSPHLMLSDDQFHPSAAGYALAASQLLPALCNALGEWTGEPALSSATATEAGPGNLALRLISRLWRRPYYRSAGADRRICPRLSDSLPRRLDSGPDHTAGDGAEMPEAVIVSTARSPIGRAMKGSLVSIRPDDLAAQMLRAALDKVEGLNPHQIDDLILGCGLPGGEQGFNMARVVAIELGYDFLPGTTVNRYCSSSLQTIRMAFHAIKAGEGDAFISAGVETVSRFIKGSSDSLPDTKNPLFDEAAQRTAAAAEGAERLARSPQRPRAARRLHRDGSDRRERRHPDRDRPRRPGPLGRAQPEPC